MSTEQELFAEAPPPEIPVYKLTSPAFLEPSYVKEGAIIEWDGEPGSHMQPVNKAAEEMMARYYEAKPHARFKPLDELPMTVGANPNPTFKQIGQAAPDEILPFVDMAERTHMGKAARITSLGEAQLRDGT